uniref:Uncharacterized protein n=1 Tax=Oryza barthii TaxID=65489 RepID=A0A0D3FSI3_9ORYZ
MPSPSLPFVSSGSQVVASSAAALPSMYKANDQQRATHGTRDGGGDGDY